MERVNHGATFKVAADCSRSKLDGPFMSFTTIAALSILLILIIYCDE